MTEQLPILLVVLPLMVAPITALCNGKFAWFITWILALLLFAISVVLLIDVSTGSTIHYELGGWQPPWGIAYEIDALNAIVCTIVCSITLLTVTYAPQSVSSEIEPHVQGYFYTCIQLCVLGLLGMSLSGDIFNIFVFLEISSLASYALIAMGQDRKALSASFNYLLLGTIGATFFLLGVGMLYAACGSLNMLDIAARFAQISHLQLTTTSLVFIVIGLSLKAAVFPLHSWLPHAYTSAPTVVSILLSATATKVAVYVLIRVLFTIYPVAFWQDIALGELLTGLGCIGIIYGSVRAMSQVSIKRLLAYSSVAQIGYLVVGVGLLTTSSLTATLLHLFNHAVLKAALFMVAGIYFYRMNTTLLPALQGLGRADKLTFLALVIAGLGMIGVPGTVGFISKWMLLMGAIEAGKWYVVATILLGSILAIGYIWKLVEALYFTGPEKPHIHHVSSGSDAVSHTPLMMALATWILVLASLYFGLQVSVITTAANTAAEALMGKVATLGAGL